MESVHHDGGRDLGGSAPIVLKQMRSTSAASIIAYSLLLSTRGEGSCYADFFVKNLKGIVEDQYRNEGLKKKTLWVQERWNRQRR